MTDSIAPADWLESLAWHLRKHDLGNTVFMIEMPHDDRPGCVQLYPWRSTYLGLLAEWVRTLRGVAITVTAMPDDGAHLSALGAMGDGTPVRVVVIVGGAEFDLLAVNTPLAVDAQIIPVPLLLSLVDAKTAESREPATAGSAVAS